MLATNASFGKVRHLEAFAWFVTVASCQHNNEGRRESAVENCCQQLTASLASLEIGCGQLLHACTPTAASPTAYVDGGGGEGDFAWRAASSSLHVCISACHRSGGALSRATRDHTPSPARARAAICLRETAPAAASAAATRSCDALPWISAHTAAHTATRKGREKLWGCKNLFETVQQEPSLTPCHSGREPAPAQQQCKVRHRSTDTNCGKQLLYLVAPMGTFGAAPGPRLRAR